ncbi:hypothetical protein T484DRAFT_2021693 [Baffinella frigidus]|nr:hypothetical protein T484DRAFT_2021693 [Cryptophyta sp. CCMP2293]
MEAGTTLRRRSAAVLPALLLLILQVSAGSNLPAGMKEYALALKQFPKCPICDDSGKLCSPCCVKVTMLHVTNPCSAGACCGSSRCCHYCAARVGKSRTWRACRSTPRAPLRSLRRGPMRRAAVLIVLSSHFLPSDTFSSLRSVHDTGFPQQPAPIALFNEDGAPQVGALLDGDDNGAEY